MHRAGVPAPSARTTSDQDPDTRHLVLSSFVSLIWNTDFQIFHRDQQISCHTMDDKTWQEAGSWALSPALMVSELFWWHYFFKLFNLIANSGLWYFQVCQGHTALWMPQKPFQLRVLALISEKPPFFCNKCLLCIITTPWSDLQCRAVMILCTGTSWSWSHQLNLILLQEWT